MIVVDGREIPGQLACPPVSTADAAYGGRRDRWVEFELYRLDDGGWLAHRIGRSNVYHALSTRCVTKTGRLSGDPARIDDLPDDAIPCSRCRPPFPQDLPFTDSQPVVRWEVPRHTWDECPTAELIKARLTTIRSRDGSVSTVTSDPVADLLRKAAEYWPEFRPLAVPAA